MILFFNEKMLESLHENVVEGKSIDSCNKNDKLQVNIQSVQKKLQKRNKNATSTAGLDNVIRLAIGCRMILRRNISIVKGLVNGFLGQ